MISTAKKIREALGVSRNNPFVIAMRSAYDAADKFIHSEGREVRYNGADFPLRINSPRRAYPPNYESEVMRFLAKHVRSDTVFADVGANVGVISMYVAKLLGDNPSGRVFAFEPFFKTREFLEEHLSLNSLQKLVVNCPYAVADQEGVEGFQGAWNHSCAGLLADTNARFPLSNMIPVRTVTLDGFFEHANCLPTLLKIDVEGAELRVLKGATRVLRSSIQAVILETHPHLWVDKEATRAALKEEIQRFNFTLSSLEPGNDPFVDKGHLLLQR